MPVLDLSPRLLTALSYGASGDAQLIRARAAMPSNSTAPPEYVGWTIDSGGRGTIDIIWQCFIVLVFCCWTSLHLNIPRPNEPHRSRVSRKLRWAATAIMFPELVLTMAIVQRANASKALSKLKKIDACKEWTLRHAFFINMGGFKIKAPDGWHVLKRKEFFSLLEAGKAPPKLMGDDLDELSRSDGLGKAIAVFAGAWLLLTTLVRRTLNSPNSGNPRLPISPLEVTSAIFVLNMLAAYLFWWHKPYDVQSNIEWNVGEDAQPFSELQAEKKEKRTAGRPRVKNLSAKHTFSLRYNLAFIPSCFVFSALHLLVLPAKCHFPSAAEKWLWVACSVGVAFTGLLVLFLCFSAVVAALLYAWLSFDSLGTSTAKKQQTDKLLGDEEGQQQDRALPGDNAVTKHESKTAENEIIVDRTLVMRLKKRVDDIMLFSAFAWGLSPALFLGLLRLILLVLALASLRELDAGVYDTPRWESYLPFS